MPIELGGSDLSESRKRQLGVVAAAVASICGLVILGEVVSWVWPRKAPIDWDTKCVQPASIAPPILEAPYPSFLNPEIFLSPEYREKSARHLGGAVHFPTESYDDMLEDPLKDERFEVFGDLHKYLEAEFPVVSKYVETVNTYGLLYTLEGSSKDEKPLVLMAHQDVVPVEPATVDLWDHPPFSGYFDGENVWGRGAADTKNSLVAILESVESLLKQGWQPRRTIIIAFGYDEEISGARGALALANEIRERYGAEDSISLIIDEGGGVEEFEGSVFATPMVAEKGYVDVKVQVSTPGGHSSKPPDHTGIGILAELVTELEDYHIQHNKYELSGDDVVAHLMTCIAKYGDDLSSSDRDELLDIKALREKLSKDRFTRSFVGTSQAIDIVRGGAKVNALPEFAEATVNYRIDVHESVAETVARVQRIAETIADKFGLGLVVDEDVIFNGTGHGTIKVVPDSPLEPSHISPFSIDDAGWALLAGTTRHVLETYFDVANVYVAPALSVGNTDTKHYWGLTQNIYRYGVGLPNAGGNAHTVNEFMSIDSHLAMVVWYYELLQFV